MDYLLLALSVSSTVTNNCLLSTAGKKLLCGRSDTYRFNSLSYLACLILFAFLAFNGSFSLYTILLGIVFGIVTMLSNFYKVLALGNGPTHITILITTASMIIPTLSVVVMGLESIKPLKLIAIAVLIFSIYLSVKKDNSTKIGKSWLFYCILAFMFQGIIGVIQKIHQSSPYRSELNQFLFISFAVSFAFAAIMGMKKQSCTVFQKKHYVLATFSGLCVFTMNLLNLRLSGVLPSQLFFPTVNGTAIIFTSLISVFAFKEKLTKLQLTGLCVGILSLVAIALL